MANMDTEEQILKFWKEKGIFQKSEKKGKDSFTFYDGPPFASGLPHYGHLLASAIKDAIPRYQVMRGRKTHRRFGWDCHGLPVENIVEKELNLKVKKDIEEYGIEKFNTAARQTVTRFVDDWKVIIPRFGRFVDMDDDYRTMDTQYTQSVWWVFKTLYDKSLIYEGYKSMHLCPRCETTLANFEVNQGYKDITDISVTVKFAMEGEPNTFFLAWTTTPWTLPGNVALAVGADIEYVYAKKGEELFILAKDRAEAVLKDGYTIEKILQGKDLVGKKYQPVFEYYSKDTTLKNHERGWKVYAGDFVTTEEGTGIVHIAPAFGEDDYALSQKEELPFVQHASPDGRMKPEVADFAGELVKPKDDHQHTDILVLKYLAEKGTLFAKEKIVHSYPHCWRCDTPLLNYAASSWFVKVTDIKDDLVKANNTVNWVPSHIKEGRFGKWLEGARDWAISRSRYFGAPIPVWRCEECGEKRVVGSLSDLAQLIPSHNTYFAMRHGQADSNVESYISSVFDAPDHLTDTGRSEVERAAQELVGQGIEYIVSSPFVRTRETTEIVQKILGLPDGSVVFDARLSELDAKENHGKSWREHFAPYGAKINRFLTHIGAEENYADVQTRATELLYDLDTKYQGKTVLIISHGLPLFLLQSATQYLNYQDMTKVEDIGRVFNTGEVRELHFAPLPHDEQFRVDVHRPYIDAVTARCSCGGVMRRVPDVFDCWFESGAMPYGEVHYLGTPQKDFDPERGIGFPADFIAEGLDQTRGWFYSLIVLGVALFKKSPYKNVIVNGLILAEDGQKMSKKLKNYPDPVDIINRYGADALRYYLLSSPVVRGEDLNFSERGVADAYRKNVVRLQNVLTFYKTFAEGVSSATGESARVLDQWILARLASLSLLMTEGFEHYELDRATKPIADFIDDLSTWYLRRSRQRIKEGGEDAGHAVATLAYTLKTLATLIAPSMPFIAEEIFQELRNENDAESVHLVLWPTVGTADAEVLTKMAEVRAVVSAALELRAHASIKVRQPLASLTITQSLSEEYLALIRDEVNVKEVKQARLPARQGTELALDTALTPELITEGQIRDVIRVLQDARKEAACDPKAQVAATLRTPDAKLRELIERSASTIKRDALIHTLIVQEGEGELVAHITP